MTALTGTLSVREPGRKLGGPVAAEVRAEPLHWMHGVQRVVLLVHGFNNNRDEATKSFRQFLDNLPTSTWRVGTFQWPGDADFGAFQWADFLSYPAEIPDAQQSARRLADFLSKLTQTNPTQELTLVGHSLGCRLILEMLDLFRSGKISPAPAIRNIMLMAAAVPVELAMPGQRLHAAALQSRERYVLFSPDDLVLRLAFPAGQALARLFNYEPEVYLKAVGLNGNPAGFASATPVQACGNGHSDYWKGPVTANYLAEKLGVAVAHGLMPRCLPERGVVPSRETPVHGLPEFTL